MVINKVIRIAATAATSGGLLLGFSGLAGATPHNYNKGGNGSKTTTSSLTTNTNTVGVNNTTNQGASTGTAIVTGSTGGNDNHDHYIKDDSSSTGNSGSANRERHQQLDVEYRCKRNKYIE